MGKEQLVDDGEVSRASQQKKRNKWFFVKSKTMNKIIRYKYEDYTAVFYTQCI